MSTLLLTALAALWGLGVVMAVSLCMAARFSDDSDERMLFLPRR